MVKDVPKMRNAEIIRSKTRKYMSERVFRFSDGMPIFRLFDEKILPTNKKTNNEGKNKKNVEVCLIQRYFEIFFIIL